MSRPHMDENDLARFLDRRMSEEERASAVAHLSESDPDSELLADAAYLLRELGTPESAPAEETPQARHPHADDENTGRDPKVVELRPPSTARTRPRRVPARWLALAAVLAGVLLTPLALSRLGSRDSGNFAALLSDRDAGLPVGWTADRAWPITRGAGDPFTDKPEGRAARLGALWVDLELAVASRQTAQADSLCGTIDGLRMEVTAGGAITIDCDAIVAETRQPASEGTPALRQGAESLSALLQHDPHFALGAWTEAALLAAARRDAAFFRAKGVRRALEGFAESQDLPQAARVAAQRVRTRLEDDGTHGWEALSADLKALMVAAHGPAT